MSTEEPKDAPMADASAEEVVSFPFRGLIRASILIPIMKLSHDFIFCCSQKRRKHYLHLDSRSRNGMLLQCGHGIYALIR
jgi:hypothetical protein